MRHSQPYKFVQIRTHSEPPLTPSCLLYISPEFRSKLISKTSYERGVVVIRCDCCDKQHLIADNFGWFGPHKNIEEILAERGEEVRRMDSDEVLHLE